MPTSLRLPPSLEADIKKLAELHHRSKNAEIIVAIDQYIEDQKAEMQKDRNTKMCKKCTALTTEEDEICQFCKS